MFGAFLTLENIDSIIGKNELFHVRGTINNKRFHWNLIEKTLIELGVNKILYFQDTEEKLNFYFYSEGHIVNCIMDNFSPTLWELKSIGVETFIIASSEDIEHYKGMLNEKKRIIAV